VVVVVVGLVGGSPIVVTLFFRLAAGILGDAFGMREQTTNNL